ncbi:MAG TPA: hypothetical protein VKZ65_08585 [Glycomyces sp.]|nr:hypothetical protein [Glycomyces sp.]
MDALVVLPGTEHHGKLWTVKGGVAEVVFTPSFFDGWDKREELLKFERVLLQVHKFRAGSRTFRIAAEYATAYTETEDIIDMLIDLDPVDVRRILVR